MARAASILYSRVNTMDAVVLRLRLESFVRSRFGPTAVGRPLVPFHLWDWRPHVSAVELGGFVWNFYDDLLFPRAIGLRGFTTPPHDTLYEAAEWYGPQDIRRSHWRYQTNRGWIRLTHPSPLGR